MQNRTGMVMMAKIYRWDHNLGCLVERVCTAEEAQGLLSLRVPAGDDGNQVWFELESDLFASRLPAEREELKRRLHMHENAACEAVRLKIRYECMETEVLRSEARIEALRSQGR